MERSILRALFGLTIGILGLLSHPAMASESPWAAVAEQLTPWDFSPTVTICTVIAIGLYVAGWIRCRRNGTADSVPRVFSYLLGVTMLYAVLQTHVDYYAQHMFYIHRL